MFLIVFSLLFIQCATLAVTSCNSCTQESTTLHFERYSGAKQVPIKHTLLDQFRLPDRYTGLAKTIVVKTTLWLFPPRLLRAVGFKTFFETAIANTWIEARDNDHEVIGRLTLENDTSASSTYAGVDYLELRIYSNAGVIGPYQEKLYVRYETEVWWMT